MVIRHHLTVVKSSRQSLHNMSRRILISLCVLVAVLAVVSVAEAGRERRQLVNAILGAALGSPGYGQNYGGYGNQGYGYYGGYGGRPSGYGGRPSGYGGRPSGYGGYNQGYNQGYGGRPSYGGYGNQGYQYGSPYYG